MAFRHQFLFLFSFFFLVGVVVESVYLTPRGNETDCILNNCVVFFYSSGT